MNTDENMFYWDDFYREKTKGFRLPSQFAAFALSEFPSIQHVLEFGCGDGRDAMFFALYGRQVTAYDSSVEAVKSCRLLDVNDQVNFDVFQVSNRSALIAVAKHREEPRLIYARFFLHALSTQDRLTFLQCLPDLMGDSGAVALEYRTVEDMRLPKTFGGHHREYVDHEQICSTLEALGLKIRYQSQGTGYAKYGDEDAIVGRCIATSS